MRHIIVNIALFVSAALLSGSIVYIFYLICFGIIIDKCYEEWNHIYGPVFRAALITHCSICLQTLKQLRYDGKYYFISMADFSLTFDQPVLITYIAIFTVACASLILVEPYSIRLPLYGLNSASLGFQASRRLIQVC